MTDNEILLALSNMLEPIRSDISEMKKDMSEMNTRLKKVELTQENVILPRLQNIEACYTSTYDRYKQRIEDYETLKMDMDVVKRIVAEHSAKLQMIPI